MLLPTFSIDNWYDPDIYKQQHIYMWQRVYTIGWLFWFIRWTGNKEVIEKVRRREASAGVVEWRYLPKARRVSSLLLSG